jgi:Zn-dependent metalloprotease
MLMKHRQLSLEITMLRSILFSMFGLSLSQNYIPPADVEYFDHAHATRDVYTNSNGVAFLAEKYKLSPNEIKVTKQFKDSDNVLHLYGVRLLNGIPVANQNFAMHVKDGKILATSSTYRATANLQKRQVETVSLDEAVKIAEKEMGIPRDSFPAQKLYLQTSPSQLSLVHQFQLRDDKQSKWFQVAVDAMSGKIVEAIDFVHHATFDAIGFTKSDAGSGFDEIVDPEFLPSSPLGWNSNGQGQIKETLGNNVDSIFFGEERTEARATGTDDLKFKSRFDPTQEIDTEENMRAAMINSFYRTLI